MTEPEPGPIRVVEVDGARLAVQTFGDPVDPAILLIAGAASSMDWWADEFCGRLAAGPRFVIRYDQRDTGQSTGWPAGAPGYAGADLVADAVALLDALGVPAAHVVGLSAGGVVAQHLAVQNADRVASVTLMCTSPDGPTDPAAAPLPPPTPRLRAIFDAPPAEPDWTDRAAVIEHVVDAERPYAGSILFDEEWMRAVATRVVDRTPDVAASLTNHFALTDGDPVGPLLGTISAPTLVLHGTDDPLFPLAHGEALAAAIPGARLVPLPGMGHEYPPRPLWDVVLTELLRHTSGGWDAQADRLAAHELAAGRPSGWFERLYHAASAGEVDMPWDRRDPHWTVRDWAAQRELAGAGRRAIVVGCGLGADAAFLAGLGFQTVGFDVSPTAVRTAAARFAGSGVEFVQADLLALPESWAGVFGLVVEVFTVQALPRAVRTEATAAVRGLVAPGGTLLVIGAVPDSADIEPHDRGSDPASPPGPPPWPLTRAEIEAFASDRLVVEHIESPAAPGTTDDLRWRAEFRRPP